MSFGAQYQHRGVDQGRAAAAARRRQAGLSGSQFEACCAAVLGAGTLMLAFAIVCQLTALAFAPLIIVQPLGAISLVITTLLNARV